MIQIWPRLMLPMAIILQLLKGEAIGIYFIDSTAIKACHNKRRYRNKTFARLARSSKSSMGYFYGFKLHAIINHKGEFIALKMIKGNVDDRTPVLELTNGLTGIIAADKGYIKQNLFIELYEQGLKMIHGIKKNMKNKLMNLDKFKRKNPTEKT